MCVSMYVCMYVCMYIYVCMYVWYPVDYTNINLRPQYYTHFCVCYTQSYVEDI